MVMEICRLCFMSKTKTISIFTGKGIKLKIDSIIRMHFSYEISENDDTPKFLCCECWKKLSDFHEFYNAVDVAMKNYVRQRMKEECHFSEINCDTYDDDNDDIQLKSEPIDEDIEKIDLPLPTIDEIVLHSSENRNGYLNNSNHDHESDGENYFDAAVCNSSDDELNLTQTTVAKIVSTSVASVRKNQSECEKFDKLAPNYMDMACELCKHPFQKLSDARKHYRVKHKQRNVWIKCCRKKIDLYDIIEHIQYHLKPDIFRCHECGRHFFWSRDLKRHRTSHQPKQFQCDICKKKFSALHILKEHILKLHTSIERQYECHICKKPFAFQHILHNHILRKHTKNLLQNECEICKKSFISKNALRIHIRSTHEHHYRQVCHICAKVYNSKHSLLMHLKNHSNIEEPRVNCKICGRSYKNMRGLNSHIATHNKGNQIFQCPHCPKISPNRNALAKHIGSIHKFKIHKCHLCDKEFKRALVLKEHVASHSGTYLYNCAYCQQKFKYRNKMYPHYKKFHPLQWLADRTRDTSKISDIPAAH